MYKIHSPSLLSIPWPFWTGILYQVSKNNDEKTLLLRVIWLQCGHANHDTYTKAKTFKVKKENQFEITMSLFAVTKS